MVELPTGTVTFLFTDIEGSTRWGADVSRVIGVVALVLAITAIWTPSLAPGLEHAGPMGGM